MDCQIQIDKKNLTPKISGLGYKDILEVGPRKKQYNIQSYEVELFFEPTGISSKVIYENTKT